MPNLDEYKNIANEHKKFMDSVHKEVGEIRRQELAKKGVINPDIDKQDIHGDCDHINTMENGSAIVLYILVMIGGAIFKDAWIIWIVATFIFLNFITRHQK